MAEKIIIGICSAGSRLKLSVLAGEKFYRASRKTLNQEKNLFKLLDENLKKAGAGLHDITGLCVVSGPGRFTGLRIGLTFSETFKTLTGICAYSVTLFEILAAQAAASKEYAVWAAECKTGVLVALTHAFKDEYFCQEFKAVGDKTAVSGSPLWLKAPELAAYFQGLGKEIFVIADAEEKADIYDLVPAWCAKAGPGISKIMPDFVIKTGLRLKNKNLSPLYLKPAKYELEFKAREKH